MSTKISQLISAADITANDLIQIVDIEDGLMAPSGTNKKATASFLANQLVPLINSGAIAGSKLTDSSVVSSKIAPIVSTNSTSARLIADRFADVVNVKDFGAVGDGVTDDSVAFQAAANYATSQARDYNNAVFAAVTKAPTAEIYVPNGNYIVNIAITSTAQIVWSFASNTIVNSTALLTGLINRDGRHINARHTGMTENSTTLSLRSNQALNTTGGVYGITSLGQMSQAGAPHSVTLQIDNDTRSYQTLSGTTYTATTVTYTNSPNLSDIKTGSIITTLGTPNHMGQITNINTGAKTITVSAWYAHTGTPNTIGTPSNGTDAAIDYYKKIWGQNTNVFLRSGNPTVNAAGYELGVLNQQSDAPALDLTVTQFPSLWGFDAVNLGTFKSSVAFVARAGASGNWRTGFASYGNEIGLQILPRSGQNSIAGVSYEVGIGSAFQSLVNDDKKFAIDASGTIEMGSNTMAGLPFIDFKSSGFGYDYDSRILATGGTEGKGQGELRFYAKYHRFFGSSGEFEGESFRVAHNVGAVNFIQVVGNVANGTGALLTVEGIDTNIDLRLSPKGTGNIRFGVNQNITTETLSGYITIKDSAGNIRKLAVVS